MHVPPIASSVSENAGHFLPKAFKNQVKCVIHFTERKKQLRDPMQLKTFCPFSVLSIFRPFFQPCIARGLKVLDEKDRSEAGSTYVVAFNLIVGYISKRSFFYLFSLIKGGTVHRD